MNNHSTTDIFRHYNGRKNIEISDDEDDIHPNIDTLSLFRWRYQERIERMEERVGRTKKAETLQTLKDIKKLATLESE